MLDTFDLIYDFALSAGDTLWYYDSTIDKFFPNEDTTYYVIDSITTMEVGSSALRVQHIRIIDGWSEYGRRLFEFIGSDQCFTPQWGFCDPVTSGICCYEDSTFGFLKFVPDTIDCDEIEIINTTFELTKQQFIICPNPFSDHIEIQSGQSVLLTVRLTNLEGQTVINRELICPYRIDVSSLAPGAYFISMFKDGILIKTEKALKL